MVQIGDYDEVKAYIAELQKDHQDMIAFLRERIPDKMIAAVIIGKYSRAQELKVNLQIEPESSLCHVAAEIDRHKLVTILGNLLENALEAVSHSPPRERRVDMFVTDGNDDIYIEVSDSGPGIAPEHLPYVFSSGFSTKSGEHRGIGLALTKSAVEELGGTIHVNNQHEGGALFTVVIPQQGSAPLMRSIPQGENIPLEGSIPQGENILLEGSIPQKGSISQNRSILQEGNNSQEGNN